MRNDVEKSEDSQAYHFTDYVKGNGKQPSIVIISRKSSNYNFQWLCEVGTKS